MYPSSIASANKACFCCSTGSEVMMFTSGEAGPPEDNVNTQTPFQQGIDTSSMFPSPTVPESTSFSPYSYPGMNSLRFLQNRQLGMRVPQAPTLGRPVSGSYDNVQPITAPLSMSVPLVSPVGQVLGDQEDSVFDSGPTRCGTGGRRLSEQLSLDSGRFNKSGDSMDLDSALDELGMLSTVTNSRRQFLKEQQRRKTPGHALYWSNRDRRLRSKSESSPNLTALAAGCSSSNAVETVSLTGNGYQVLNINTDFVTGVTKMVGMVPGPSLGSSREESSSSRQTSRGPLISQIGRSWSYRNTDPLEDSHCKRRRSIPRMSRFRKDRYRQSRCPYSIPNRLSSSLHEGDLDTFGRGPFSLSGPTPPSLATEAITDRLASSLQLSPSASQTSKSTESSPVKPSAQDSVRLTRSRSAENLASRFLDMDAAVQRSAGQQGVTGLDLMTTQLTNLHMS